MPPADDEMISAVDEALVHDTADGVMTNVDDQLMHSVWRRMPVGETQRSYGRNTISLDSHSMLITLNKENVPNEKVSSVVYMDWSE